MNAFLSVFKITIFLIFLGLLNAATVSAEPDATGEATAQVPVTFQPLIGRWQRTDSPYVIEVKSAGADGTLTAAYFNPRPINVESGIATEENGKLRVKIVLRDVNYDGSNYNLVYDKASKLLSGQYFLASTKETFEVSFRRE